MTIDPDGGAGRAEDLIESDSPSQRSAWLRQGLDRLVPARVGRQVMAVVTVIALAMGVGVGYLVGRGADGTRADDAAGQSDTQTGQPPDGGYIPFVPEGSPFDEGVVIFGLDGNLLTFQDLGALGETAVSISNDRVVSGLDGVCGHPSSPEAPSSGGRDGQGPGAVTFVLGGASLTELISADLDVLAASTLRGQVELVRGCANSDDLAAYTDGVQDGIGDEYALFSVDRLNPASGVVESGLVVLVRVGGKLVEIALIPHGRTAVPNGVERALAIAQAAVERMLAP